MLTIAVIDSTKVFRLARALGMNIAVLYRETSATERVVKEKFAEMAAAHGVSIDAHNVNALDPDSRDSFIRQFAAGSGPQPRDRGGRFRFGSL